MLSQTDEEFKYHNWEELREIISESQDSVYIMFSAYLDQCASRYKQFVYPQAQTFRPAPLHGMDGRDKDPIRHKHLRAVTDATREAYFFNMYLSTCLGPKYFRSYSGTTISNCKYIGDEPEERLEPSPGLRSTSMHKLHPHSRTIV